MTNWMQAHVRKSAGIVRREAGEDVILIPTTASGAADLEYVYRLNATGVFMWDRLAPDVTIGEILVAMSETFQIDQATAEKDGRVFLSDIAASGLILPVAPEDATLLGDILPPG